MIPIRDVMPARTTPAVAFGLMAVHGLVLALLLADPMHRLTILPGPDWPAPATVLVSVFVQSGALQASASIWALWLFGENVEDRLGHGRFLALYTLAGGIGFTTELLLNPGSTMALTGAGGAVAGVLGGHLALYPGGRMLALGIVPFRIDLIEIPAGAPMVVWLLCELVGGTGVFALAGGFATGAALVRLLARRDRMRVEWWSG